jgi:AAA domain
MTFQLRPAKREGVWLLLGLAGGTGSGKTWSAMEIAQGLAGTEPFAVVDTENGRASHYAEEFRFEVVDLDAPFTPDRYQQAIHACVTAGRKVIVVDSMSHEWEGVGGLLEQHETEMGGNQNKNLSAWIKPKMSHRKFVTFLLQVPAHIILCFRAAERVEAQRGANGKMEIVPKRTLTGLDGWVPITEKSLPFELTASFLLTADQPGVPKPIKLQQQHRLLIPTDQPLSREVGTALSQWAAGATADPSELDLKVQDLVTRLLAVADALGTRDLVTAAITKNRRMAKANLAAHIDWLERSLAAGEASVEARSQEPLSFDEPTTEEEEATA